MKVLSVALGVRAALDGECGAAMQASEAHDAPVFYPNGVLALHLYRVNGAFLGAQASRCSFARLRGCWCGASCCRIFTCRRRRMGRAWCRHILAGALCPDCVGNEDKPLVRRCQLFCHMQRVARCAEIEDYSLVLAFCSVPSRKSGQDIASCFAMPWASAFDGHRIAVDACPCLNNVPIKWMRE